MTDPVLVADIGGTNARFAVATIDKANNITIDDVGHFLAADFETLRAAVDAYLDTIRARPRRACFAAAGPVTPTGVDFTNSHWTLSKEEIRTGLNLDTFEIVNDFHALAAGVTRLQPRDFVTVKDGEGDPAAPVLVIGPGTGLGQALIIPTLSGPQIVSTEGGHVAFAPQTDQEIAIMKFIARERPRVVVEELLSGRGLTNIYDALCALRDQPQRAIRASEITMSAIKGDDPLAVQTVAVFCEVLGRTARNAVLAAGARGGVILGGGILPRIRDVFLKSGFVGAFLDSNSMREYIAPIPVRMIVGDHAPLYGAASLLSVCGPTAK